MVTLCSFQMDAVAFIDALGTIHFCELHVRRLYHSIIEISAMTGLGTCALVPQHLLDCIA